MPSSSLGKRPDFYIIARILDRLWRSNGPTLRTRLQTACNLNYDVFTSYMNWMMDHGLIFLEDFPDGQKRVVLSEKGRDAYRQTIIWMREIMDEKRY